jgi:D-alanyl-D-alanine-carboxypeptidase/D-alanyl-D-alanine-endopeptidase
MTFRLLLCWAVLLAPPWGLVRAVTPELPRAEWTIPEVEALLKRRVAQNATRGIAVALIAPDGKIDIVTAGHSGNAARPNVDGDTLYEIGSITKVFTATILAQSVEEGGVKFDAKVREVLPDRAWRSPGVGDVTLTQLSTHTSGLPRVPGEWRFVRGMLFAFRNPYAHYSANDLWTYVQNMEHEPRRDHEFAYSNLGAGLLGQVLAAKEGTTYEAMVERRILKPLGMTWSGIRTAPGRESYLAVGHSASLIPQSYWDIPALPGAGALRSSASEMAKFILANLRGTLAGANAAHGERMKLGTDRAFGLGWGISRAHRDEILWHNGGTGGFRTFAGFSRQSGRGVVVLSNVSVDVDDLGFHLLNREFELVEDPRRLSWFSVLIGLSMASALVVRTWFATDPPPVAAEPGAENAKQGWKRNLRARFAKWRNRQRVESKITLFWTLLNILIIAIVLYLLGPWEWLGPAVRTAILVIAALLVLRMVWKLRHLPWRGPAPRGSRVARYIEYALCVVVLAVFAWNFW